MFFELIATFFAGLGMAGLVLLLNKISGGRLPKWAVPVGAGAAMLVYAIWSEMTWAQRTASNLPEGILVVRTVEEKIFWKPWTFIKPQKTRFVAADRATSLRNPNAPDTVLVNLYFHARWQPVERRPQLIDCSAHARADVTEDALTDPAGQAHWIKIGESDPLIRTICKG